MFSSIYRALNQSKRMLKAHTGLEQQQQMVEECIKSLKGLCLLHKAELRCFILLKWLALKKHLHKLSLHSIIISIIISSSLVLVGTLLKFITPLSLLQFCFTTSLHECYLLQSSDSPKSVTLTLSEKKISLSIKTKCLAKANKQRQQLKDGLREST